MTNNDRKVLGNTARMSESSRNTTDQQPFRFLNLPKELRLMIYERLSTKVVTYDSELKLNFVHLKLPGVSILATCRQVNKEGSTIIKSKLDVLYQTACRFAGYPGYCVWPDDDEIFD
jgi:hypothetical protein